MLSRLELYLIALAVFVAGVAGMYFYAKHEGRLEERAVWEGKQQAATKADLDSLKQAVGMSNQIALDTQEQLKKGKARSVIDRGVIEREIKTNTVYAADCFPPTGVVRWNAISAGGGVMSDSTTRLKLDPALPAATSAPGAGQQGRNAAAQPSGGARNVR